VSIPRGRPRVPCRWRVCRARYLGDPMRSPDSADFLRFITDEAERQRGNNPPAAAGGAAPAGGGQGA
jgi:hypothetical protein